MTPHLPLFGVMVFGCLLQVRTLECSCVPVTRAHAAGGRKGSEHQCPGCCNERTRSAQVISRPIG
jgi:hypothetical protein